MNFLVLLNNAPLTPLFKDLALELRRRGHNVVVATDSDYTKELHDLDKLGLKCYSFANFYKEEFESNSRSNNSQDEEHWLLHADYDRSRYYGFSRLLAGEGANRIAKALLLFFERIVSKDAITDVFYENISNAFAESACKAVKRSGGRYHGFTASRIPGMATFSTVDSDIRQQIDDYMAKPEALEPDLAWAEDYITNLRQTDPDYMKTSGLSDIGRWRRAFKVPRLRSVVLVLKYSRKKHSEFQFQFGRPIILAWSSRLRLVMRRLRVSSVRKLYSDPPDGKDLFVYPLHYHPEASTSIRARYYDELNVIKNIAFSLRGNEWLVVKDHMSAIGFEKMSLYRQIASLPSVTLLKPNVNAKDFIAKCNGVITLTSTLGYEAAVLGKRVAVFGEPFYASHPLVKEIYSFHDLRDALDYLKKPVQESAHSECNRRFVAAYKKTCFDLGTKDNGAYTVAETKCMAIVDEVIARYGQPELVIDQGESPLVESKARSYG